MSDYWLWQHEYRKRWITYSEGEIQILNKAVDDKEVTVSLPNKNTNKVLIIDFENMVQRNKKTLYEQRIRCLVFSTDFYLWLWKNDNDEWCSYKPNLAALLEVAYLNGDKLLSYYDNGNFEVNLESFELTNKDDDMKVFSVKREKVDISTSVQVKNIQELDSTKLASLQLKKPSIKRKHTNGNTSNIPDLTVSSTSLESLDVEESSAFSADSEAIIPVDIECPEKDSYHICTKGGTIFSATLNQTCVQRNNNKFYLIQLLEDNKTNQFAVWRRWGRVGVRGQTDMTKYGRSFEEAKTSFEKKFYEKTKNRWSDIKNFSHVSGKYDLLHMDLNSSPEPKVKKIKQTTDVESKLALKLQALLEIISDRRLMEDVMSDMSYDSNKTPLGKLTVKQVQEGYIALNKISEILKQGSKSNVALIDACNAFYTKIPHNFGMKTPPLIRTQFELDTKINMLEALSNIAVAMGVLNNLSTTIEHPLDKYYKSLDCSLEVLNFESPEYKAFEKSLKDTHGPTHSSYEMEIVDIFRCHKTREESLFKDFKNKLLLWHGSRITNWIGILKEGLRIAPPEAPTTGYMFGKGIYFADVSSKSANYCYATKKKNEGLILLCEVSLGNQYSLYEANERLPATMPSGFNSVKGNGRIAPSEFKSAILSSEAKAPFGPLIENPDHNGSLHYNEYIVYDVRQVKMRYLARVKFNFK